ncbi:MAG TPA: ethanolamine ammonia-lyase light chain EutC, partial [Anaerolineales bacterium]|nr:ethanolamine ammonia-lyase light chain EutC [Anaerolineales bacterium]
MDDSQINAIIEAVIKELSAGKPGAAPPPASAATPSAASAPAASPRDAASNLQSLISSSLTIDLPDPTLPEHRYRPRVANAKNPDALPALIASTTARIGVGRAGPHYNTFSLLLFQGDHAITQDAL